VNVKILDVPSTFLRACDANRVLTHQEAGAYALHAFHLGSRACGARKGPLDFRHPHLGFNRVGNETILMGGMMHLIELFRTGLTVAAPRNLWA
jgi:hypothetical protein